MSSREGVALVTGASRGIGRAAALRLASDGWPVAVNYRSDAEGAKETVALIESSGGQAVLACGDVSSADGIEETFAAAEAVAPVLVLVNNAGVRRDTLAAMMKRDEWDDVIRTNLDGVFFTSKRALKKMISARWGRIVNVTSVIGLRGNPGQTNYGAAKAGVVGLTKSLALEVAKRGITVNAIAPGLVKTTLTENLGNFEDLAKTMPIGRIVEAEEIAAAIAFFASDDAAAITGQVLCVDGGMTA